MSNSALLTKPLFTLGNNLCWHKAVAKRSHTRPEQTLLGENGTGKALKRKAVMAPPPTTAYWSWAVSWHSILSADSWLPLLINLHNGSKALSSNGSVFPVSLRITVILEICFHALQISSIRNTCPHDPIALMYNY